MRILTLFSTPCAKPQSPLFLSPLSLRITTLRITLNSRTYPPNFLAATEAIIPSIIPNTAPAELPIVVSTIARVFGHMNYNSPALFDLISSNFSLLSTPPSPATSRAIVGICWSLVVLDLSKEREDLLKKAWNLAKDDEHAMANPSSKVFAALVQIEM